MNIIDILIVIPVAWGILRGLRKGGIAEITAFIGIVIGIVIAMRYSGDVEILIREKIQTEWKHMYIGAFFITFASIVLILYLTGCLLASFMDLLCMGWLNKTLGGVLGGIKWFALTGLFLWSSDSLSDKLEFISATAKTNSLLYYPFLDFIKEIFRTFAPEVNNFIK